MQRLTYKFTHLYYNWSVSSLLNPCFYILFSTILFLVLLIFFSYFYRAQCVYQHHASMHINWHFWLVSRFIVHPILGLKIFYTFCNARKISDPSFIKLVEEKKEVEILLKSQVLLVIKLKWNKDDTYKTKYLKISPSDFSQTLLKCEPCVIEKCSDKLENI